jgi:hypothetical protein
MASCVGVGCRGIKAVCKDMQKTITSFFNMPSAPSLPLPTALCILHRSAALSAFCRALVLTANPDSKYLRNYKSLLIMFCTLHCSPNILRVMSGTCSAYGGEERRIQVFLVGKHEGKRPLARSSDRWEGNVTMDLQEVGCGGMDWIDVAQYRDRSWALVNLRFHKMRGIS